LIDKVFLILEQIPNLIVRILILFILFQNFLLTNLVADPFLDLMEEDREVYGSEKREKFKSTNIFWEIEDWENHRSERYFFFYRSVNYPKFQSLRLFPFYNKIESKIDERNYFRVLNFSKSKIDTNNSYSFFPIYFWENDEVRKKKSSLLPFIFSRETVERVDFISNYFLSPVYYHEYEKTQEYAKMSSISPFHIRNTYTDKNYFQNSYYFPIIPLISYNNENNLIHRNIFWLIDLKYKENFVHRLTVLPLFYYSAIENFNESFISPIYSYLKEGKTERNYYLNLIYTYKDFENSEKKLNVLPFFYSKSNKFSRMDLFIPFFYSFEQDKYSFFYLFPFIREKKIQENEIISSFDLLPFLYTTRSDKKGLNSLYAFPFVGYQKDDFLWIFPFYYSKNNIEDEKKNYKIAPFYYTKADELQNTFYFFNYYSNDKKYENESQKIFFPFYFNFKDKTESITLSPYKFEYSSIYGDSVSVNILGYAFSTSNGPYKFGIDFGNKEERYYLDTDFSYFHSLFRLETRISSKSKFNENSPEFSLMKNQNETESPKQKAKKEFNRRDSFNFWGWTALFQLISYQNADSKYHFRLFPLTYLTWDKDSEDKIILIPPILPLYLDYKEGDELYKVFFPFYARQKNPEEERTAYLLFTYFDEKIKLNDYTEKSILWPMFNIYSDNNQFGFRFAPLIWFKENQYLGFNEVLKINPFFVSINNDNPSEKYLDNKLFSYFYYEHITQNDSLLSKEMYALFFYSYNEDYSTEKSIFDYKNSFSIFHYHESNSIKDKSSNQIQAQSSFYSPLLIKTKFIQNSEESGNVFLPIPFLYSSYTKDSMTHIWLMLFKSETRETEKTSSFDFKFRPFFTLIDISLEKKKNDGNYSHYRIDFLAYYLGYNGTGENDFSSIHTFFPFYNISESVRKNPHDNSKIIKSKNISTILYYSDMYNSNSENISESLIIYPFLYYSKNKYLNGVQTLKYKFWFFIESSIAEKEETFAVWPIFPLYYNEKIKDAKGDLFYESNFLLFWFSSKRSDPLSNSIENKSWIFPFYFSENKATKNSIQDYNESNFYSLFYFSKIYQSKNTFELYKNIFLLFEYSESQTNKDINYSINFIPFISLINYSKNQSINSFNFLYLLNYTKELTNQSFNHFFLFPFYYDNFKSFYIFPFVFLHNDNSTKSGFALGMYYNLSKDYYRYNFLYLIDLETNNGSNPRLELDFFFKTLQIDNQIESQKVSFLYGISEYNKNQYGSNFNLLWMGYEKSENYFDFNLLPIYRFEKNSTETTHTLIPLLGYLNKNSYEDFRFLGLGGLYYFHNEMDRFEELEHILLGTVYIHKKKFKNRYNSYGSMWGWLWQYEYEEETGYNKFSILKLLSREEYNGEVRYLGIKF
jgi:hypothetical protein